MKKILVVHNKYRYIGGEDIAVDNEISLLRKHFEVNELNFENNFGNIFMQMFYFLLNKNFKSHRALKQKLKEFKPDLIYIHNTWFKASTVVITTALKSEARVFLKMHNFRYFCTRSYLSKNHFDGFNTCNCCGLNKNDMGFFNKYFSESFYKSLLVIRYGKKYFKLLNKKNLNLLVLTEFHKNFLCKLGINIEKINVFPNFLDLNTRYVTDKKENYFLYAGRISKEKGIKELIDAFLSIENKNNYKLKVVGEGPEKNNLEQDYRSSTIEFLGALENKKVLDLINNSNAVVTATKLFEGQPTLLCEASSLEVPSIFPKTGGISEFFPKNYQFSFQQFDYKDLKQKMEDLIRHKDPISIGKKNKVHINKYLDELSLINLFNKMIDE